MEFEDILVEVGDSGRYQKELILVFFIPLCLILPPTVVTIIFMVSTPDHWCNVPEVVASNLSLEQQRQLISPEDDPKCRMYDVNYTEYLLSGIYRVPNGTETKNCDGGWQYDRTNYDSTIATQWNMYCKDNHYATLVLTLSLVGSLLFTPVYGFLSDKIGRRLTFYIVLAVTTVVAFVSLIVRDLTTFAILRTIYGGGMPTLCQIPFIVVLELVAPEMRTRLSAASNLSSTLGMSVLPLVAYLTRSWVTLGFVTSAVLLPFFLYWTYLPESPRWLVSQERYDEAAKILKKIGEKNSELADLKELTVKLKVLGERMKKEKEGTSEASFMDFLRYPQLRKTFLILSFCWVADIMAYYGLMLNVTNLAGNEFINFFLTATVEFPGYITAWVLMEKLGRRWSCVGGFFFTGIACMLAVVDFGMPYADVAASMLGKYFASYSYMIMYQQGSELYPTVARSLGMGMSYSVAMGASIATPYIIYLAAYGKSLPFIIIGCNCLVASVAASFLSETLNENLPQTLSDTENFGRDQEYFSWNRKTRSVSGERAATLALQLKSLEGSHSKDSEIKQRNTSKSQQNSDFLPERTVAAKPHDR